MVNRPGPVCHYSHFVVSDLSNMEGTLFLEFSHVSMKLMNTGIINRLYIIMSIPHVHRETETQQCAVTGHAPYQQFSIG